MNIKSDRDYIINILERVKSGEYAVPEFQRDFVWSTKQVIDLFDSIMKGYPIGSLILWKPETAEFNCLNRLGGLSIGEYSNSDKQYVLDGRQRLTALISSLCAGGAYYGNICINLEDMQIINVPTGRSCKPHILGLGTAFDTYELVDYIEGLKQSKLSEDMIKKYADQAKRVNRILLSYELGYISVIGGSIDNAEEVFSRLNSQATKISPDYMLQALAYQPNHAFLFAREISTIRENLSKYNFEHIDRKLILKCVYHYLDVPFIDGREQMILDRKELLPQMMKEVAVDVEMATEFLYSKCGIIDCKMIPYVYQFVMVALFFKNNRTPNSVQLKELVRWFFYTTYSGYFTNTSLATIRKDIHRFRSYSLGEISTPMDYVEKHFDVRLPDTIQLGGVRSCAMAALSILKEYKVVPSNATLIVYVLPDTGVKTWGNTFFLSNKNEGDILYAYLKGDAPWMDCYAGYALSEELLSLYREGKIPEFVERRQLLLQTMESHFIQTVVLSRD
jgi:hypothetical protein